MAQVVTTDSKLLFSWCPIFFVCSFMRVNIFAVALPQQCRAPFFGFCLLVFCQAGPPQWIDCLAQTKIGVECFPQTHRRIASSGIDSESAAFRLLTDALLTELTPLDFFGSQFCQFLVVPLYP